MRTHRIMAALGTAILLLAPIGGAAAQQERGGVRTETQERAAAGSDSRWLWNVLGLVGLFGLLGLRKGHDEDSYHPAAIE